MNDWIGIDEMNAVDVPALWPFETYDHPNVVQCPLCHANNMRGSKRCQYLQAVLCMSDEYYDAHTLYEMGVDGLAWQQAIFKHEDFMKAGVA